MASYPTRWKVDQASPHFRRCDSEKTGFVSREHALDISERMMELGRVKRGCHLQPYLCDRCGQWHLANKRIEFPPGLVYGRAT